MEIASRLHGPVVDHGAYKLAMVHVVAELKIGFAVVDYNMKVDESSEQLNMICCFDMQEHYETLVQEAGGRMWS